MPERTAPQSSRAAPPQPAPRLDLKVGFRCNNRCTFCVQGDKRSRIADRTTDEIRALLAEHRPAMSSVVLTGGEPTVREDLLDLVRYARSLGYERIQIQTNGRRLAYPAYVRALADAGATEFAPALHGSTAEVHDALTRAPGSFVQTLRGIYNVRALGLPVITNSVIVRRNGPDLPNLAKLLVRLDVQQVQFAFIHPVGSAEEDFDAVVPRFAAVVPFIHAALRVVRSAGIPAFTEAVPYCFMQGFEACVVESRIPDTYVVDRPAVIEDYTRYRWTEGKAHGPPCEACTYASVCEGPWREYPERYGWGEFRPRRDPLPAAPPNVPSV